MEYSIYKFDFRTGVHFGTGALDKTTYTFKADQLFSALYIEAMKLGIADELYDAVDSGRIVFSDGMPYINRQYLIPKPMIHIEGDRSSESEQKKAYKKMKYLPVEQIDEFLSGEMKLVKGEDPMRNYGHRCMQTMAHVRRDDDTSPHRIGTFYYEPGCGVYIIVGYNDDKDIELLEQLLTAVSYVGLGGKKSSGLGKFELIKGKMSEKLRNRLGQDKGRQMLISSALPLDDELDEALNEASYLLEKRTGFVAPPVSNKPDDILSEEWQKKRDLYVFASGSCFNKRFAGGIYDVSKKGEYPVFRYAKAMFMEV